MSQKCRTGLMTHCYILVLPKVTVQNPTAKISIHLSIHLSIQNHNDSLRNNTSVAQPGTDHRQQLIEKIEVSQPTVSRALTVMGDNVIRIGSGPSIQYTLRDAQRGFSTVPINRITHEGCVEPLGDLVPVYPGGFVMVRSGWRRTSLPWPIAAIASPPVSPRALRHYASILTRPDRVLHGWDKTRVQIYRSTHQQRYSATVDSNRRV